MGKAFYDSPFFPIKNRHKDGEKWGKMGKNGEKWGKNFMGKAFYDSPFFPIKKKLRKTLSFL